MNEIAKKAASARLRKAMELEKLSTKDTAGCLGLNPSYISMFLNEKTLKKCPAHAFERLLHWCNHGTTLKGYNHPEGTYRAEKKDQEPVIKVKPEALERRKKELAERAKQETPPVPEFKETSATVEIPSVIIPEESQHIDLKPGEEVEFRRTIKDEHQDNQIKTGEYIDLVESIRLVAEKLPGNLRIEIRINAKRKVQQKF